MTMIYYIEILGCNMRLGDYSIIDSLENSRKRDDNLLFQIGRISFIGELHFVDGIWIGLKFDEPIGTTNGTVEHVTYFECPDKCGIFIRPQQISPIYDKKISNLKAQDNTLEKNSLIRSDTNIVEDFDTKVNSIKLLDQIYNKQKKIDKQNELNMKLMENMKEMLDKYKMKKLSFKKEINELNLSLINMKNQLKLLDYFINQLINFGYNLNEHTLAVNIKIFNSIISSNSLFENKDFLMTFSQNIKTRSLNLHSEMQHNNSFVNSEISKIDLSSLNESEKDMNEETDNDNIQLTDSFLIENNIETKYNDNHDDEKIQNTEDMLGDINLIQWSRERVSKSHRHETRDKGTFNNFLTPKHLYSNLSTKFKSVFSNNNDAPVKILED